LPGKYGIGNLGLSSREFVNFLQDAGFLFWQTCPVGPTGYGDSPYQVFSSSAGNPYLIDWQPLLEVGVIDEGTLVPLISHPENEINYGELYSKFFEVAKQAHINFEKNKKPIEDKYGKINSKIGLGGNGKVMILATE
jgi:4-alpha-glucanotransferase